MMSIPAEAFDNSGDNRGGRVHIVDEMMSIKGNEHKGNEHKGNEREGNEREGNERGENEREDDDGCAEDLLRVAVRYAMEVSEIAKCGGGWSGQDMLGPFLRSIRHEDRTICREEMEKVFTFAHTILSFPINDFDLSAEDDDTLWSFLMHKGIIGPLASPDTRLVMIAVREADGNIDQLERIFDAVWGNPVSMQSIHDVAELARLSAIQKSRREGMSISSSQTASVGLIGGGDPSDP